MFFGLSGASDAAAMKKWEEHCRRKRHGGVGDAQCFKQSCSTPGAAEPKKAESV